ncbi:diguanylate cyclase [Guyparkeria sp. 1SP6A2]|nr:diguanylate cyclase [Guyparkeria sp. 1SP6A2]
MKVDLDNCDREPIHIPGHIQPFAALMLVEPSGARVLGASANLADVLGPTTGKGTRLADWLPDPGSVVSLYETLESRTRADMQIGNLHCTAHRQDRGIILEFEPGIDGPDDDSMLLRRLDRFLQRLSGCVEPNDLLERAAEEIRDVAGVDRAMVYRFDADMNGEIVIERTGGGAQRYIGQHFPASDIPRQARELYRRNRVRIIPDIHYAAVPVHSLDGSAEPLDLGLAVSRAVSPIHLEYLDNMHVGATLTISLLDGSGELWGMLVCHNDRPCRFPPAVRLFCGMLGEVVSTQLDLLLRNRESEAVTDAVLETSDLLDDLPDADNLVAYLEGCIGDLLRLVGAEGLVLRLNGELIELGRGDVDPRVIEAIVAHAARANAGSEPVAHDAVAALPGVGNDTAGWVAGALHVRLGQRGGDCAIFLRAEQVATIDWAGNPNKAVERNPDTGRLTPRKSFDIWQERVQGLSLPWQRGQLRAAAKFAQLVGLHQGYRLRQMTEAKQRMTYLARHDSLTGLPNRTLLLDRIEQANERSRRYGHEVAVLFTDLDGFKEINDELGHEAGDQVLVEIAHRLEVRLRDCDTVARLGGDEFVVLAEIAPGAESSERSMERVAERIIEAVATPMHLDGGPRTVGASVGIACRACSAGSDPSSDEILRAADAAMYDVKRHGRGGYAFAAD